MKQIFKLVGGRGVVSYVGYLKHHTVFFFERILRSLSLANCLPISLNLIAFVSTLQKATQMKFFTDKIIVNGYLLNWIFSYQVHNILTQGWSTLHGSWQTDWRGRPDTYDFITLYWTMLLYICHHFFFFIPVLYLHASIWGLPVLILYCIPANSYNCGIIVMI